MTNICVLKTLFFVQAVVIFFEIFCSQPVFITEFSLFYFYQCIYNCQFHTYFRGDLYMEGVFRFKSWILNTPGLIHGGTYYRNFTVISIRARPTQHICYGTKQPTLEY